MKLSEQTIAILKNFSSFGSNIWIKPGNTLEISSDKKTILASATVKDKFPEEFGIYKLSKFLGVVSLFNDVDLDFSNNGYVVIKGNGSSEVKYVGASKSVLIVPPDNGVTVNDDGINLSITQQQYQDVIKAANTLDVDDVCFIGKNGKTILCANSVDDVSAGEYSIDLGVPTTSDYLINFKIDNLKMIPGDYDIRISKSRVSQWTNKKLDVNYIVLSTSKSVIS